MPSAKNQFQTKKHWKREVVRLDNLGPKTIIGIKFRQKLEPKIEYPDQKNIRYGKYPADKASNIQYLCNPPCSLVVLTEILTQRSKINREFILPLGTKTD